MRSERVLGLPTRAAAILPVILVLSAGCAAPGSPAPAPTSPHRTPVPPVTTSISPSTPAVPALPTGSEYDAAVRSTSPHLLPTDLVWAGSARSGDRPGTLRIPAGSTVEVHFLCRGPGAVEISLHHGSTRVFWVMTDECGSGNEYSGSKNFGGLATTAIWRVDVSGGADAVLAAYLSETDPARQTP